MTIAKRLIILLAVPLLILLGIGIFTRQQLANIEERTRFVADSRVVALARLGDISRSLTELRVNVRSHLLATNVAGRTSARTLFDDPAYRPDTMKIYPCVVVKSAELFQWWRSGRYTPYDDETLSELLLQIKQLVPPYVRIERVIRDIPSTSIEAGCQATNLREEVQRRMRARGLRCQCIRCRQVRDTAPGPFSLVRRQYDASDGTEIFLSFEEPSSDRLASLLRLRIPSRRTPIFSALHGAALIRELHSYGHHLPLHDHREDAVQHRGLGQQLVEEAERIAREEFGCRRMAVISGVGVREYYRRFGYTLEETYMVKPLAGR